jgi:hypothetical protein
VLAVCCINAKDGIRLADSLNSHMVTSTGADPIIAPGLKPIHLSRDGSR